MYITIDEDRCTICGKCVRACPADVLEIWDETSKVMRPDLCTSCGHCAAICPEDAIECADAPANRRFSVQEPGRPYTPSEWRGELQSLLRNKRSMRKLKRDPLPSEVIRDLIYYGEKAPSAKNFRERRYYVITNRNEIDTLEEQVVHSFKRLIGVLNPITLGMVSLASKDAKEALVELKAGFINIQEQLAEGNKPVFRNAPCIICIAAPSKSSQGKDDCVAAQHYMMLYGEILGLGSCIIGYAQHSHKILEKHLGVPKDFSIYAVSIFGYPKLSYPKEIIRTVPEIVWKA